VAVGWRGAGGECGAGGLHDRCEPGELVGGQAGGVDVVVEGQLTDRRPDWSTRTLQGDGGVAGGDRAPAGLAQLGVDVGEFGGGVGDQ
jgi:hypothetical protein